MLHDHSIGRAAAIRCRRLVLLFMFAVAAFLGDVRPAAATGLDFADLAAIPVQHGGRVKPFDTFAIETAKMVTGKHRFEDMEPIDLVLTVIFEPQRIENRSIVQVTFLPFKDRVGLERGRHHFTYREIVDNAEFRALVNRIREKQAAGQDLDRLEREVSAVFGKLAALDLLMAGEEPRWVPTPNRDAEWLGVAQVAAAPAIGPRIIEPFKALGEAFVTRDAEAFARASSEFRANLAALGRASYPEAGTIDLEIAYNASKPFRRAAIPYALALVAFLFSFSMRGRPLYWTAFVLLLVGFGLQTYGLVVRTMLAGRAPVSNMYESLIFVGWAALALAIFFEAMSRARIYGTVAGAVGALVLFLAHNLPIDPHINPLVAVLRSTWLNFHVTTILISYAALILAGGIAHFIVGTQIFAPQRTALMKAAGQFLYRAIQVGILTLGAGIIMGGIWANASWGRFWGWDPKETWALITWFGFLVIVHGRQAGWLRDRGTVFLTICPGLPLLVMTYYGVNYFLVGLHSYAGGDAGVHLPPMLVSYMIFEAIVLAGYWIALRRADGKPVPVVGNLQGEPRG